MILRRGAGSQCLESDVLGGLRFGVGDGLGSGEDVEAEIAAAFGPFVVLLGEDGSDEADDRGPVEEDPDDVGAAPDLAVESPVGVVGPDLPPDSLGSAMNARMSARASCRCTTSCVGACTT